jgi:pimeloyl-ACP methyl ester carboxylesterase
MLRYSLAVVVSLLLSACGNFLDLRKDLREANDHLAQLAGVVSSPSCRDCPTILVALGDEAGKIVHSYRIYEHPGDFEIITFGGAKYLLAFNDLNDDFEYRAGEPCAVKALPDTFGPGKRVDHLELTLDPGNQCSSHFGNLFKLRGSTNGEIDVELGKVVALDDPMFEPRVATIGMWQPLRFMKEGHAGLFFLEPYSRSKVPVLFVHGINATPRDFTSLIARLDRKKYQPWVLYYPSGLEIGALGDGLLAMLSELQHRYDFQQLHLISHSMGGLVSRAYLGACVKSESCSYLRSFISISAPFGGHEAAQSGVDRAPTVMPVWRSLAPGSPFLNELFATPLPHDLPHHLLFGYHNTSLISRQSGDGSISLASQLRYEAQQQAADQRGFNEDHGSILLSDEMLDYVSDLLGRDKPGTSRP